MVHMRNAAPHLGKAWLNLGRVIGLNRYVLVYLVYQAYQQRGAIDWQKAILLTRTKRWRVTIGRYSMACSASVMPAQALPVEGFEKTTLVTCNRSLH